MLRQSNFAALILFYRMSTVGVHFLLSLCVILTVFFIWFWINFGCIILNFQDTLFVKELHHQSNIDYMNLSANYRVHPVNKNPIISINIDVITRLRKVMVCLFDLSLWFKANQSNIDESFQARVQLGASNGGKLDRDFIIIDTTINVCKIQSGIAGNVYLKSILEKLSKSSNFTYACPFEKVSKFKIDTFVNCYYYLLILDPQKLYQVSDYTLDSDYPSFMFQKKYVFMYVNLTGKVDGSKSLVYLCGLKVVCGFGKL